MEAVKFKNVHFSYETNAGEEQNTDVFELAPTFALSGIDLTVEEGEFVAVLGHNGSGKSTLARLTNGLLTPDSGEITVLGLDAGDEKNLFEIRKQVGVVFQNPDNQMVASIVEDDIAFGPENIGIEREEIGRRIQFALEAVGMQAYRHATPSRLSGGQKQRIAIAGVLALKPKVMILDEATAMLDPRGRKEVMDVILRLNKEEKITVILITHFPEEAVLADRAIVMHGGKIVLQGKPEEVLSRGEELRKYSLTTPKSIAVCRALSENGLQIKESMSAETVAENIAETLSGNDFNFSDSAKMNGAGTRLKSKKTVNDEESGRVSCENLSYIYNSKSPFATYALHNVNLEIQSGEFFGIIGHTGSGKSTFVQHLNALLKAPMKPKKPKKVKKGESISLGTKLCVAGFDLTDGKTDFRALRSKVGMVFQYPEYQLFAETVFEDVAFGLKNFRPDAKKEEIEKAVREALNTVGLSYDEVAKRSPFDLSGGQKRRVAIAGVIVTKPEILVLDEPAAGLDPLGKEEIMALLHKIHEEWCKTVIIVSHDMDEISENCSRAAIFSEGKVVAVAKPQDLFADFSMIENIGLDVPFTAKLIHSLAKKNIQIPCDYTLADFIENVLDYAKSKGAGMRLTKGGQADA